jgi:hypothetical protein
MRVSFAIGAKSMANFLYSWKGFAWDHFSAAETVHHVLTSRTCFGTLPGC